MVLFHTFILSYVCADASVMPTSASHICKHGISRTLLDINEQCIANWRLNLLNQDDAVREENSGAAICVLIRDGVLENKPISIQGTCMQRVT